MIDEARLLLECDSELMRGRRCSNLGVLSVELCEVLLFYTLWRQLYTRQACCVRNCRLGNHVFRRGALRQLPLRSCSRVDATATAGMTRLTSSRAVLCVGRQARQAVSEAVNPRGLSRRQSSHRHYGTLDDRLTDCQLARPGRICLDFISRHRTVSRRSPHNRPSTSPHAAWVGRKSRSPSPCHSDLAGQSSITRPIINGVGLAS